MAPLLKDRSPKRDLQRSAVSCNDQMLGPGRQAEPSPQEIMEEMIEVVSTVTEFAMAVLPQEQDAGCGFWPYEPPERFTGPWNHELKNPILIHSNNVGVSLAIFF
jgi:hypothetical protein